MAVARTITRLEALPASRARRHIGSRCLKTGGALEPPGAALCRIRVDTMIAVALFMHIE
jgi:hypothetical protein